MTRPGRHGRDFHSDALHVVERYTPSAADALTYEVTIEDPKVFSATTEDAVMPVLSSAGKKKRPIVRNSSAWSSRKSSCMGIFASSQASEKEVWR